jgi:hypothetical protein
MPIPSPLPADEASAPQSSIANVVDFVMAGNRFVTIPYVFSMLVLTFRRNMGGVHTVRTGHWPIGQMVQAAIVTSWFGWWGFPFGIIYSILSCYYLFRGGRDATKEILEKTVGREEANRILRAAPKPQLPGSIWIVRAIVVLPFVLVFLIITAALSTPMK